MWISLNKLCDLLVVFFEKVCQKLLLQKIQVYSPNFLPVMTSSIAFLQRYLFYKALRYLIYYLLLRNRQSFPRKICYKNDNGILKQKYPNLPLKKKNEYQRKIQLKTKILNYIVILKLKSCNISELQYMQRDFGHTR